MGQAGRTSTTSENDRRVPHSILSQTAIDTSASHKSHSYTSFRRNVPANITNEKRKCTTAGTKLTQLSFNNVSKTQARRITTTDFQPEESEQIRVYATVSTGEYAQSSRIPTKTGLDGKNRYFPGLFPRGYSSKPQMLFKAHISQRTAGNDVPTFRPQLGAISLCLHNRMDSTAPARRGHKDTGLPGRLPLGPPRPDHPEPALGLRGPTVEPTGLANKSSEVNPETSKNPRVPGNHLESMVQHKNPTGQKDCQNKIQYKSNSILRASQLLRNSISSRPTELFELRCSEGQIEFSSHTIIQPQSARNSAKIQCTNSRQNRNEMVAQKLLPINSHTYSATVSLPDDRRLGHSLGGTAGQYQYTGPVETARKRPSLQSKRVTRSPQGNRTNANDISQQNCNATNRQQNSHRIHSKRRRNKVSGTDDLNVQLVCTTGSVQHKTDNVPYSGHLQQRSGPPISENAITGMAPAAVSAGNNIRQMGSADNGPLCIENSTRGEGLLFDRPQRRPSENARCVRPSMVISTSLGLPTTLSDATRTEPLEQCIRDISSSSSSVGTSILATGPETKSVRPTTHDLELTPSTSGCNVRPSSSEGRRDDSGSMEMWGWSDDLPNWSPEQKKLLLTSWRPSTLKTYRPAWNRWCEWARTKGVAPTNPSGSDLGRFIIDLHLIHKLSYNSILLHKSVVSTMCNTHSSHLSSDSVVKHALKAVALQTPKASKSPIWDIDIVIDFISKSDTQTSSLYEASRQTATLLLLCSGRRVHDLTLLRIDADHCVTMHDSIIFWPEFGSKTDSYDYRQSGWKLLMNKDNPALDPVTWIKKVIALSAERRKHNDVKNLFISTCGAPKAASKTIVGTWVKSVLTDSGVTATPGSVRSAVASKSWINNSPLDEILTRGNWRSGNTFARYYRRQVLESQSNPISRLFDSI